MIAPLILRAHILPEGTSQHTRKYAPRDRFARYALVVDTETTVDIAQDLTFGFYQFCELQPTGVYECHEEGIFFADKLDARSKRRLLHYVRSKRAETPKGYPKKIRLYSRSEFVEKVFFSACDAGAVVVGHNLGFECSHVAAEYRKSNDAGGRGWSFILSQYPDPVTGELRPNSFRPRIQLRPKDSKAAFIRLAGGDSHRPFRSGRFLDTRTLAWALRNKSLSLESACKEFGVPGKLDHTPTGRVSRKEIDYCRQDVRATAGLLNALGEEFRTYPLADITPERAYSAASFGKSVLSSIGVVPPARKFDLDDRTLGICMQSYYGGRAEVRIRQTVVPIVCLDFLSQYSCVDILLGLWEVLTAEDLKVKVATRSVRRFLSTLSIDQLFDPHIWRKLKFFALVQPQKDMLPVRTVYGQAHNQTSIGVNPLISERPVWYAGPDIVASILLTGRVPKTIRAIRLKPSGKQKNMSKVEGGTWYLDPEKDDFFQKIIEERKKKDRTDPLYGFLKILANAACYGIYAEINREQTGKNNRKTIQVFSGEEQRICRSATIEKPGPWYFPPISLVTAGGRLLLAMLEKLVSDAGGSYMAADTDSLMVVSSERGGLVPCKGGPLRMDDGRATVLALSWEKVREIAKQFEQLNPYDRRIVPGSILNIVEEINFDSDGRQRQIYGLGISAKRYALFTRDGSNIKLVKASEHGLGLYYRPFEGRDADCETAQWISEGWLMLVRKALGLRFKEPAWFKLPVMRRVAITTPNVMTALRKLNRDLARPYNFALSPVLTNLTGEQLLLLGPFVKGSRKWQTMPYVNIYDGKVHTLRPPTLLAVPHTFDLMFAQYWRHPEFKSLAPNGSPCKGDTRGLLQRCPISASGFRFIGKETERGWEQEDDISTLLPSLVHYETPGSAVGSRLQEKLRNTPLDVLEATTDLSRHTLVRVRRGQRVHPTSLERLRRAVASNLN
jgi:hypothetical protein